MYAKSFTAKLKLNLLVFFFSV